MDCAHAARVRKIKECADELISEIRQIKPMSIILLKFAVYDALFRELKRAGLPVADSRLPFPGSGQQKEFHRSFPREMLNGLA
jgi:hypothetical protein